MDSEHLSESVLAGHYFGSGLTVMFVRRMAATPAATSRIGRPLQQITVLVVVEAVM
jgi:hypothetical protein